MASYYYLISSLPTLSADGGMPFSYEEFLRLCQSNVSGETYPSALKASTKSLMISFPYGVFVTL